MNFHVSIFMKFLFTVSVSIFSESIKLSVDELSEIKRVSTGSLRLLGFKPLSCLKDYHNLRPSTFLYPSEEVPFSSNPFVAMQMSFL